MLDELNELCKDYHLISVGIGGLIILFLVHLFFKDVVGRWKYQWKGKRK